MNNEGGSEFSPEPIPEAPIEAPVEMTPEAHAIEVAPEPPPVDATPEPAGNDQDVLSEAKTEDGAIDIATAEDAGSRKISEEINEKRSDAGVEGANETVATGNLSSNPEHAANELAAVREHANQRTAFLIEQAKAAETDELRQAQELDAEADAMEAAWQAEQAESLQANDDSTGLDYPADGPPYESPIERPSEDAAVDSAPAEFCSKFDDGSGAGIFEYRPNADGTTHVTYRYEKVDEGMAPLNSVDGESEVGAHLSWDEDPEGRRTNTHLTDHQRDEKGNRTHKPIDFD